MSKINFIDFKKLLNKNNIYLFDAQNRIAHYRLNNLNINKIQTGGSISNDLIIKINNLNSNYLNILVNSLLDKNIERIQFILTK